MILYTSNDRPWIDQVSNWINQTGRDNAVESAKLRGIIEKLDQMQAQVLALTEVASQMLRDKDNQDTDLVNLQNSMMECGANDTHSR